jgi:hypothetical protein
MYLPSDSPLLVGQQRDAAKAAADSDCRIQNTRLMMAKGRADLFQTVLSPEAAACVFGIGTAVNVEKMLGESLDSRAAILNNGTDPGAPPGPTMAEYISQAPEVISLNAQADQVGCSNVVFSQRPAPKNPHAGMPQRGPNIVQSPYGPMYFRGDSPTFQPASTLGLTGYSPTWSDAWVESDSATFGSPDMGVASWIRSNPWLSLAIAGAAVLGLNQMSKRGRR